MDLQVESLAVLGTLNSLLKCLLQHHSSKSSILWCSAFFIVQLSHAYMTTEKTIALTRQAQTSRMRVYYFARVAITNNHKMSGLKQAKFVVSQSWSLKVQNQGVGKLVPSEAFRGGPVLDSSSSWWAQCPWLVAVSLQCLHLHMVIIFLCLFPHTALFPVWLYPVFRLIRTPIILDQGSPQ